MKKSSKIKIFLIIGWFVFIMVLFYALVAGVKSLSLKGLTNPVSNFLEAHRFGNATKVISRETVQEESATIKVVEDVSPAVVSVVVKTVNVDLFNGPTVNESGIGTGFIVDSNGLIVTNSHVVDNSRGQYSVVLKDGTSYEVQKIHLDPISDLAILEVTARNLPTVTLGDSDQLKVGQKAIAIGNALGRFQNTVTEGVISGIGRQLVATGGFGTQPSVQENAIQTDAAINPGNSGGPLLNLAGQVIGINVATTTGADNISFAIPVNTLKPILKSFAEEGRIVRPYIGISYTMITKEIAALRNMPVGAFVSTVLPNTPAEKAGLQRGDIIVKIDGQPVNEGNSISKVISEKKVGDKVTLTINRNDNEHDVTVELGEAPNNTTQQSPQ